MKCHLSDERATGALAEEIFSRLSGNLTGWTVLLSGELGAGKSTFARAFIKAAGHSGAVPSPTYTLVEPYELAVGSIYHIDLYRISSEEELRYLGWNEFDNGVRLVEWPERVPSLTEDADLLIELAYDGNARTASLRALSERGAELIQKIN